MLSVHELIEYAHELKELSSVVLAFPYLDDVENEEIVFDPQLMRAFEFRKSVLRVIARKSAS